MELLRKSGFVLAIALAALRRGGAQEPLPAISTDARPLPDVSALMHEVESRQRATEALQKDYLYRETDRSEELDGQGRVKKITTREADVFWIDGVNVRRLVKKDGKDLSPEDLKKDNDRIDKEVAKARERRAKADAKGVETDPQGHEEITVSRILELGQFTNERRVALDGRDTIVVDYTGDPKAKTRNRAESFLRDVAGTVWIDEQDKELVQLQAQVEKDFKIGGGLVVDLHQGSSAALRLRKVNGEVWLPVDFEAHGKARVLLFGGFSGNVAAKFGDYRRFKATSTILPATPEKPSTP